MDKDQVPELISSQDREEWAFVFAHLGPTGSFWALTRLLVEKGVMSYPELLDAMQSDAAIRTFQK